MEHIATYFSEAHNVIYDNIEERLSEQSWVKQTVSLVTPKVIYFRYFLQLLLSGKDADHQRFKEYYNTVSTHIDDMDKINPISKEFPRHWVVLQYIFLQLGVPLLVDQINAVTGRDAYSPKNIRERIGSMTMMLSRGIYENRD